MFKPVQNASPVSWVCACDTCIADGPCEKAFSTARPPSVSVGADAYMTVCGLGYIMWPDMEVGTDVVTMVAGRLTVAERERVTYKQWSVGGGVTQRVNVFPFFTYLWMQCWSETSLDCCQSCWTGPGWSGAAGASHRLTDTQLHTWITWSAHFS